MIVALSDQKIGLRRATLALHLAGAWYREGKSLLQIDADPKGPTFNWPYQRATAGVLRLLGIVGLAADRLRRDAQECARDVDHLVIQEPPRIPGMTHSASFASELALFPVQPSPFDGYALGKILWLLGEARAFHRPLVARFTFNRSPARTIIAREMVSALADHAPSMLTARITQQVIFTPLDRGAA